MATRKSPDFEKSLDELSKIVESLESGDLSLEDSLKTFERGIQLTQVCQKALIEAEQRVQTLIEKDGKIQSESFDQNAKELADD